MPVDSESFWKNSWNHRQGTGRALKGAILAAGLGKRMQPLSSRHLPKPLFPLGGNMPMVELWVRCLASSGITDISLNICVLAEAVRRHFESGSRFAVQTTYVDEDTPSGTLGGVCKQVLGARAKNEGSSSPLHLPPEFQGQTIIVPSGDIVSNFKAEELERLYRIHRTKGAALTVVLVPVSPDRRADFGTAVLDRPEAGEKLLSRSGRVTAFREKDPNSPSNLCNASIYVIEKELIETLDPFRTRACVDENEPFYDFGRHVFPALLGELPYVRLPKDYLFWGVQYDGLWFDVGRKRDYIRVNECILNGELEVPLPYQHLPWGYLGHNVDIDFNQVRIRPPVILGHDCVVQPGATLGPFAIVGDGWLIQRGAEIHHSVLWPRYPIVNQRGEFVSDSDLIRIDPHQVGSGVTIRESIVAGGSIRMDLSEVTATLNAAGEQEIRPLDYLPAGPRA